MARKPMVTRTLTTLKVKLLCLNIETAQSFEKTVVLVRTTKDDNKLLSILKSRVETETEKVVHIIDKETVRGLYKMPEEKFIESAEFTPITETNK